MKASLRAPALLLSFHLLFFGRAYSTEETFFLRDYSIVQTPVKEIALAALRSGAWPLWLPSLSGGQPLSANPNYFIFHPGNILPLLLGVTRGLKAFLLLQYLVASLGAFVLARRLGMSELAGLMAALTFAYGGFMCSLGNLLNALAVAALLPWLLCSVETVGRGGSVLALPLLGALQIFSGEPVPALLSFLLALAYALGRFGIATAGRVALLLLIGVLVAGPQVVPAAIFFQHSDRASGLSAADALKWSLPPIRLVEILHPEILGSTAFAAPPRYLGSPFEDGGYPYIANVFLGPVALLLCVPGAASPGTRKLLCLGGLAVLLGLGKHLPLVTELHALAPWAAVLRYPSKLYLLVAIAAALVAARGLDRIRSDGHGAGPAGAVGLILALGLAAALPPLATTIAGRAAPSEALAELGGASILVPGYVIVLLLVLAGIALLLISRGFAPEGFGRGLVLLHALTLLLFMPRLLPTVPPSFYAAVPPPLKAILDREAGRGESFRIYWERSREPLSLPSRTGSAAEIAFAQRQLGLEFVGRLHGLDYSFDTGWEGVTLGSVRRETETFEDLAWPEKRAMLDRQNVRYVLGFEEHPDLPLLSRFDGLERRPLLLHANPNAWPRVTPPEAARLVHASTTAMVVEVLRAGELRIAVSGYPLWEATLDGEELPIESPADASEIVVRAPRPGLVRLRLDPWDLRLGFFLCAVSVGLALAWDRRRRRHRIPA